MRTAATGLRWTRATTVATAATLVAVAAHLSAKGPAPSPPALAFLVLALSAALAPFLARPASAARIVLLTVGGQFVAHATLALAAASDGGANSTARLTSSGAPGGAHDAHAMAAADGSVITQLSDHAFPSDVRMLLVHLAAALVVGAWLAAGERAVWTVLTLIWRALLLPVLTLATPTAPTPAAVPAPVTSILPRIVSGSVVRRGPPSLLAA